MRAEVKKLKAEQKVGARKAQADVAHAQKAQATAMRERDEVAQQLEAELKVKSALQTRVEEQKAALAAAKRDLKAAEERAKAAEKAKAQAESSLDKTISALDADLDAKSTALSRSTTELRLLKERATELQAKADNASAEFEAQKAEYQRISNQRVASLEAKLEEAKAEATKSASTVRKLRGEVESKDTMVMALQAERDHLVSVMRDQFVTQDEEKVNERMASKPVVGSDEVGEGVVGWGGEARGGDGVYSGRWALFLASGSRCGLPPPFVASTALGCHCQQVKDGGA